MRIATGILLGLFLVGCGDADDTAVGVDAGDGPDALILPLPDGDRLMTSLDDDERLAYCTHVFGDLVVRLYECPVGPPPGENYEITFPNVAQCVAGFDSLPGTCVKTVDQAQRCLMAVLTYGCSQEAWDECGTDYCQPQT